MNSNEIWQSKVLIYIVLAAFLNSCTRDPEVINNDPTAPQATLNITSRVSAELTIVSTDQTPGITYGAEIVKIINGEESEEKLSFETVELDENHSYTWITSDLQPGMTYSARTYISNGRNRKYSGKKTATTPSTSKATLSDVTLVGDMLTAYVVDNGGRQIEDMGFIAGESAERKDLIRKEKKQATVVNGNSFSLPLNTFRGGRTYYIIAYATDSQEDSGYSNTPFEIWFALPVETVTIDMSEATVEEGGTITLKVSIQPEDATDQTITWTTSDAEVATVEDGIVIANKEGTATITATAGGKSATCNVTVNKKQIPVTLIVLNTTDHTMVEGDTYKLEASVFPENATDKTISWKSSDSSVVNVEDGTVTAIKEGKATITATSGDKSAICVVTVKKKEIAVSSITLNETSLTLDIGQSFELVATVLPEDATNKTVIWASDDPDVVSVANGMVTALKAGGATVFAAVGGISATCTVTVREETIPVKSITIDESSLTLKIGDTHTLTASIDPENATEYDNIEWESSNPSVASVSDNGTITAIKEGSATITASAGGKSDSCVVTVVGEGIAVSSVTLDKTSLTLTEGDTSTLVATVLPTDATDKTVTWDSSDTSVATVSDGTVTAIKEGTATITASAGGKSATCAVTVNKKVIAVTSVTLDKTSLSLTEGETSTLVATVLPADATDKTVTWSSSDSSVATVSDGTVTAIGMGTATITASAGGKSATCDVTVTAASAEGIPITSEYFPDSYFREYINKSNFDKNGDGVLSDEEIALVERIGLSESKAQSLAGIEYFVALKHLNWEYGQLTSLDLSHNTMLSSLSCRSNKMTYLNVSNNPLLIQLDCQGNYISDLDLNNKSLLVYLYCNNNQLTQLDVSDCDSLKDLRCGYNQITSLDLSNKVYLEIIDCNYNALTSLILDGCTSLKSLSCWFNDLSTLDLSSCSSLQTVFASYNPNLTEIWLKIGQTINHFDYDSSVTTIKYKE